MTRRVVVNLPGRESIVASSFCAPCLGQELQQQTATLAAQPEKLAAAQGDVKWSGPIAFEGVTTGDGRFINQGASRWENLPIPLRWTESDQGAHKGAVVVGTIDTIERRDDGALFATGIIDTSTENGYKVFQLMSKGILRGVSVDMDEMDVEMRVRKEIYDKITDEEDKPQTLEITDGYVKVGQGAMDDEIMVVTDTLIRAATLCDIPAFKNALLTLTAPGNGLPPDQAEAGVLGPDNVTVMEPVVVAAAPIRPPAHFFANPSLNEPTPISIEDDGRIYGHIALWGTCHTGFANSCVTVPRSRANYAHFRTGDMVLSDGSHIPVGKITMSTGHASTRLAAAPAAAHYDDTGAVAAYVSAGEDRHGIWVSGTLSPGLTDAQMVELRAAPMSGDWRSLGGNLELVALLAVNMPGFPVPRTKALVAAGYTSCLLSPVPVIIGKSESTALDRYNSLAIEAKLRILDKGMQ